jgi:flagellar biosynthesis/type III secretory pathway protein FliH
MSESLHPTWIARNAIASTVPPWAQRAVIEARAAADDGQEATESPEAVALRAANVELAELREAIARTHAEVEARLEDVSTEVARLRGENVTLTRTLTEKEEASARAATETTRQFELAVVDLAIAVATRVVARELTHDPALVVAWAREAIASTNLGPSPRIAVGTAVGQAVPRNAWGELASNVEVDPALPPEACEVRGDKRVVDLGAEERIASVGAHLESIVLEAA